MIAHVGGLPLEESLVGLAPALAAVGLMIQRVRQIRVLRLDRPDRDRREP